MAVIWLDGHVPNIAKLPMPLLQELRDRIKPVILKNEVPHHIVEVSPSNTAYTWAPELKETHLSEWIEVARIETYHTCGYIALFKPTVDEVLSQIPEHLRDKVTHFTTLTGDSVACFGQGDGHRAVTILYQELSKV